ncbi:MAG: hypothetical protein C0622_14315 [Desulfuromonas sp.]|nr:MAG: hypothetical protein C0622_14315 [Desulfuromonas sp.]
MVLKYLFPLLIMLMTLTACQPAKNYLGNPELPYPPEHEPVIGDILHLPTGVFVTEQQMLEQAVRSQVVFVGETHDNPASHRLQETVLAALQQHNPGRVALAMEMFTPNQQPVLDRWAAGELSEKDFLKEVDWYQNWSMNFAFYRGLLTYSRDHGIKILALNADEALKRKVSRTPFEELSSEEQQLLPEMDHNDIYQKATSESFFAGHPMGQAMLEGFQRVQTLWDETMAANLAAYLQQQGTGQQVLVVAGGNHVRYGFGIPRRMYRRVPASYVLIGSEELDIPEDKQDRLMKVEKPNYPMVPYHFITFTAYEDLPNPGVKLGVMLEQSEGGLLVKGVVPGSNAEQNGIRENDLLTRIDSLPLVENFDLVYELQQKKTGDSIVLELQRDGEALSLPITFVEVESHHGMK